MAPTTGTQQVPMWEQRKENAAPLVRGRNVAILEQSLRMDTEEERLEKEHTIQHYERLVRPSEVAAENYNQHQDAESDVNDDPLIHWLGYIHYYQQTFPSDTQQAFLLQERCTRALVHRRRYADDSRFVDICLSYASHTSNPMEVFKYLHSRKVGSKVAKFFVAWAFQAEKERNYKFAEKIYKKALSNRVQPPEYLESRRRQFERRVFRAMVNQAGGEDEELDEDGRRGVLGHLSEDAFRRNDRSRSARNQDPPRNNNRNVFPTRAEASSSNLNTFTDRNARRRERHPRAHSNNNHVGGKASSTSAGFAIFVEDGQENEGYSLERPMQTNSHRHLPTERDRIKENTMAAEPWNERGGLYNPPSSTQPATSTYSGGHAMPRQPSAAPLEVFVDEECAQKQQKMEDQQQIEEERRRRHRDERTFRPREGGDASVAELLRQDPLRYVKNPSKRAQDEDRVKQRQPNDDEDNEDSSYKKHRISSNHQHSVAAPEQSTLHQKSATHRKLNIKKGGNYAFDENLLTGLDGTECCFIEMRVKRSYFKLVDPSTNFNLLNQAFHATKDDSAMDMDESTIADASMEDVSTAAKPPMHGNEARRVLFRNNSSFEVRDRSLNVSQCSSTVIEAHRVGVNEPEEETINTKIAMKELSMMFSSPALGLQSSSHKASRPMHDGEDSGNENDTSSFSLVGQLNLGNDLNPNHSLVAMDTNQENNGAQNPLSRIGAPQSEIDSAALRTLSEDKEQRGTSCTDGSRRVLGKIAQDDHFSEAQARVLNDDPGFPIYEDSVDSTASIAPDVKESIAGFSIYEDKEPSVSAGKDKPFTIFENAPRAPAEELSKPEPAFQIYTDEQPQSHVQKEGCVQAAARLGTSKPTFQIYTDDQPQSNSIKKASPAFAIFDESKVPASDSSVATQSAGAQVNQLIEADGDTATFSQLGEVMANLEDDDDSAASSMVSRRRRARKHAAKNPEAGASGICFPSSDDATATGSDGDTARLSLLGDVMNVLDEMDDEHTDAIENTTIASRKDSIITDPNGFGDISMIDKEDITMNTCDLASPTMTLDFGSQNAVDYNETHKRNTQSAAKRKKKSSSARISASTSLTKLLSVAGNCYHVEKYALPKIFKKSYLDHGETIKIGSACGLVMQELGRGAYGIVVLLKFDQGPNLAVKASSLAQYDTLAWEYEVLQKVEKRISPKVLGPSPFPYPKPMTFLSLADGGIMSMTAASGNGLTLIDVCNLYKFKLGENIPELLAIHYTVRMLSHMENLHWHAKILHCDIKPDNWVLMGSSTAYEGCKDFVEGSDLMMVDFGRAVDLTSMGQVGTNVMNLKLAGEASEESMMCVAMRNCRPWSFDIDTFGLCASAHTLLFGKHLTIKRCQGKRYKPSEPFKRYWQRDLWVEFFDTLLNSDGGTSLGSRPRSLRDLRLKFESYLNGQQKQLDETLRAHARKLPSNRASIADPLK